jgi:hypothetical protein
MGLAGLYLGGGVEDGVLEEAEDGEAHAEHAEEAYEGLGGGELGCVGCCGDDVGGDDELSGCFRRLFHHVGDPFCHSGYHAHFESGIKGLQV